MSARNNGRTLPRGPWSFSFVGTTVILFSWLAYCEGFEVRGVGTYRAASVQAGEVIGSRTQNFNFSITVKDCKWFLHFALANPFTDADYSELSYDGTNLYRITVFESWLNEEKKAGKHVGPNAAEAMVIDGEVPRFSYTHHGSIVWLAYASGCYFAKVRNGLALPPAFPGVSTARSVRPLNEFWQRVILEMHSENLFPSEVVYIETNAPGFNQWEFTNLLFRVGDYTNLNGFAFCKKATLMVYAPFRIPGQSQTNLIETDVYNISAEEIILNAENLLARPNVAKVTLISDARFRRDAKFPVESFSYMADRWHTKDEARLLPEFKKAYRQAVAVARRKPTSTARFLVLAVFMLLLVLPALFWRFCVQVKR